MTPTFLHTAGRHDQLDEVTLDMYEDLINPTHKIGCPDFPISSRMKQ